MTPRKKPAEPVDQPDERVDQADEQTGKTTIADLAREIELQQLRAERDKLRDQLGDADDLAMVRAEVAALKSAAARAGVVVGPRHMAEGTREELERVGYATDPWNGKPLTKADLP